MTAPRHVSAAVARRFFVLRHLLAPPRSLPARRESVLTVFERFGSLQFDPLEIAGRNHDIALAARIPGYRREWTDHWLYTDRVLYETYNKMLSLVPVSEMPWHRLTWDKNREAHEGGTFDEHAPLVEEMLSLIRDKGALVPRTVEPRKRIDWYWRPTNQVRAILEALAEAGLLGISRRDGNLRVYDLVERLFPADILADRRPEHEQRRHRLLSRYRAHGLLGTGGQAEIFYSTGKTASERSVLRTELLDAGELIPVKVEGVRAERFVVGRELPLLQQAEGEVLAGHSPGGAASGVAFLAPLDPFCWDREFLRQLFAFDYVWEVYVPAKKRRWGYYVLPLLYGDRLVGRIEPRFERSSRTLRVVNLWFEARFDPLADPRFIPAFAAALEAFREFGGMTRLVLPRHARSRLFVTAVREQLAA